MKMEQLGGSGNFNPVHSPDPYSPKGDTPNAYAHRKSVAEARIADIGKGGVQGKGHLAGSGLEKRFAGQKRRGNQNVGAGRNLAGPLKFTEAEEDMGPTKTGQKGKRRETINLEPKQSDEKIF